MNSLYRLGAPIFQQMGPCSACGADSDTLGDHAIHCASSGERISRHNGLRDAIFHQARYAQLGPQKEVRNLIPSRGDKPADIFIPNWVNGHDTAFDVSVVSPLQLSLVQRVASDAGFALQHRHQEKMSKHQESCHRENIVFAPLIVSTYGAWHKSAEQHIKSLARAVATQEGADSGDASRNFFGRLAIKLCQGNAALINSRLPSLPPPWLSGE